jgi:hypothetical protein
MQECVAAAKIKALVDKQRTRETRTSRKIIPYMTGVFGDSELPNLEAEMAMFAEKCYARRELARREAGESESSVSSGRTPAGRIG